MHSLLWTFISRVGVMMLFLFASLLVTGAEPVKSTRPSQIPCIDISQDKDKQTVIAAGTQDLYQGHPYSVTMPDGKTIFLTWCINHGGFAGPMARSDDGGKTWTRIDSIMPEGYRHHKNCPSIYYLVNSEGNGFLWVFTAQPLMPRIVSTDNGKTWSEKEPLGFPNVMAFSSIIPKNPGVQDGKYIGFYHHRYDAEGKTINEEPAIKGGGLRVVVSETSDAGFTWSTPRIIAEQKGVLLCEPFAFWSPDKKEICCLLRENTHKGNSMVIFSSDHGQTWTPATYTSWELTGDRHLGGYLPDGRLIFSFRDQALESPTRGHFVAWVGTYNDIKKGLPGQYRIKLLHSNAGGDCGYPGMHLFDNGDVLALTYIKYQPGNIKHSIVSTRFNIMDIDKRIMDIDKKN